MNTRNEKLAPHLERVLSGLLAVAADALLARPRDEAVATMARVEGAHSALSFNVSITGAETVLAVGVTDLETGAVQELAVISITPPTQLVQSVGLH